MNLLLMKTKPELFYFVFARIQKDYANNFRILFQIEIKINSSWFGMEIIKSKTSSLS